MFTRQKRSTRGIVAGLALLLTLVFGYGLAAGQTYRVGITGPMTMYVGIQNWGGASIAAEEINQAGGILKRKVELIKIDTNEVVSVTDAVSALERAIATQKIQAATGSFRSEAVLAMQDIAVEYKVLHFATPAASPEITQRVADKYKRYKYCFRPSPESVHMAEVYLYAAETIRDKIQKDLGIKDVKLAIVADKLIWADPIIKLLYHKCPSIGITVVGDWRVSPVATDLTAELTAVKASGAHILITPMTAGAGLAIALQVNQLQTPVAVVGMGSNRLSLWKQTEGKINYVASTGSLGVCPATPKSNPFLKKYIERYGDTPTTPAATYDVLYMLKAAIEKANSFDPDSVVTAMEKIDIMGAQGRLQFLTNHQVKEGEGWCLYPVIQFQDGDLKTIWPRKYGEFKLPPWMVEYWKGKS
jgi:branched-chain amino acid transport system substrate-binding protein